MLKNHFNINSKVFFNSTKDILQQVEEYSDAPFSEDSLFKNIEEIL